MKLRYIIIVAIFFIFSACTEQENEFLRCTVNGIPYEDLDIGAYINSSNISSFSADFDNDSVVLVANVPNVPGEGTYSFYTGTSGELSILYYGTTFSIKSIYPSSYGSFTITEVGNQSPLPRIRGNFSGVAYNSLGDSLIISDGEFSGW